MEQVLQHVPQRTLIAALRQAVTEWRKREDWSRETVTQVIVEGHERINAPTITGCRFDPNTRDTFERMRVNADRLFRWLDDEGKDNCLLPSNFLPTLFATLPADLIRSVMDEFLEVAGFKVVRITPSAGEPLDIRDQLCQLIKEGSEAQQAFTNLLSGVTPDALQRAEKELTESAEITAYALSVIQGQRAAIAKAHRGGKR